MGTKERTSNLGSRGWRVFTELARMLAYRLRAHFSRSAALNLRTKTASG